jgi:hypothetical protein
MKRYLCWLAVLGIVALPDWASAGRPGRVGGIGRPIFARPIFARPIFARPILARNMYVGQMYDRQAYAPPVYSTPVYSDCSQVSAQPPVHAVPNLMLAPPRVETSPRSATPTPAPAPKPKGTGTGDSGATRPPANGSVRPVAGSDTGVSPMPPKQENPNPPKKVDPPAATPDPLPKFPEVVIPKDIGPLPKLEVPKEPDFTAIPAAKGAVAEPPKKAPPVAVPDPLPDPNLKLPPLDFPKDNGPKLPPLPGATATAAPAPAPAFPEPLIPSPSVPVIPDPAKPESLPSLTLPPDVPLKKESTSKSSPLAGGAREMTVNVFAATGEKPTGFYRTVGFYNHTARDLNLTIEGRAVKLPARTYLHAKLAATFTWGQGDQPLTRETVPDGSAGVDVVFRSAE